MTAFLARPIVKEVAMDSIVDSKLPFKGRQIVSKSKIVISKLKRQALDKFFSCEPPFYFKLAAFVLFLVMEIIVGISPAGMSLKNKKEISLSGVSSNLFLESTARAKGMPLDLLLLVNQSSLKAVSPPVAVTPRTLASLGGVSEEEITLPRNGIIEYVVKDGDTLSSIADKFDLKLETILWANNLQKDSKLKIGTKLVILPVDGVVHQVKEGDTVSEIAKLYKAKIEDIIAWNSLSSADDIFVGDILLVPGGEMPPKPVYTSSPQIPVASSYFICPLGSSCRLTQGLHWYNAVDFDANCGDPIFAAAGGKVLRVSLTSSTSKWIYGGAGNHITILHPNGVVTFYGHIRSALVMPGQEVSQGQMIATVGGMPDTPGAGLSTGCHLHFGVHGARNPFAR